MNTDYHQRITISSHYYCLVNKNWIEKFKESFDYKNISSEINSGKDIENIIQNNNQDNFEPSDKSLFSVIKNLNFDSYIKYNNDLKNKNLVNCDSVPELAVVNFIDSQNQQHQYWVPNNFEIIPRRFIEKFQEKNNNNEFEQKFDEIQIIDSIILINLPYDSNGSGKYISLIGELNYDNSLEIKSVLVTYKEFQRREILEDESYNLRNIIREKEKKYFKSPYQGGDADIYDECFAIQLDPNSINNNDFYND